jgi:acetolactate decarboxylase
MHAADKERNCIPLEIPSELAEELDSLSRTLSLSKAVIAEKALRQYLEGNRNAVYLSAPVNAMMKGIYVEQTTIGHVRRNGNFGLGTFNHLDGEMVMLDGKVYQLSADGFTHDVEDGVKTPFACVTNFTADTVEDIEGEFDDASFNQLLESMIPSNNMFYAIRIDGFFNHVKVWSVRKQENNTPLSAVADAQPEFEYDDIEGTLAGFYSPRFIKSLNMPGFHLHFLTADRKRGGHLHGCNLKRAVIGIQHVPRLIMDLPLTLDYLTADLKR